MTPGYSVDVGMMITQIRGLGISKKMLAARLGISVRTLYSIEQGERPLPINAHRINVLWRKLKYCSLIR